MLVLLDPSVVRYPRALIPAFCEIAAVKLATARRDAGACEG